MKQLNFDCPEGVVRALDRLIDGIYFRNRAQLITVVLSEWLKERKQAPGRSPRGGLYHSWPHSDSNVQDMITHWRKNVNTESALKALEEARISAQSAQKAAALALESISKFYSVIGDDSWNDIRSAWQTRQDIEDGNTLYRKVAVMKTIDDKGNIVISLSNPIETEQPKPPKWSVDLSQKECAALAHALLRESGVTK